MEDFCAPHVVKTSHKPYTSDEILARFKNYIQAQKPGLQRFYKLDGSDDSLKVPVARGLEIARQLMDKGCPAEEAAALSVLALWDIVMFIDNSISMGIEENGARVKTLTDTLNLTSTVYSFGRTEGITAVRFLNTPNSHFNITPGKINPLMKRIVFEGLTNMGTKLRDKVLVNHVHSKMRKPVLVVVLSDAEITGEAEGLLKDVITSQTVKLTKQYGPNGPDVVAYQFAKIGNDQAGEFLVASLDNDKKLGRYIDCMGGEHRLEDIMKEKWRILPKLLLGAISPWWDTEIATSNEKLKSQDGELTPTPDVSDDLEEEPVLEDIFAEDCGKGKSGHGGTGTTGGTGKGGSGTPVGTGKPGGTGTTGSTGKGGIVGTPAVTSPTGGPVRGGSGGTPAGTGTTVGGGKGVSAPKGDKGGRPTGHHHHGLGSGEC